MKVKNLVLFGFVLSALNYLSAQIVQEKEDGTADVNLEALKNVNLDKIRGEVGDKLESMVGEFGTAVSSIVGIGSEAFDRYIQDIENVDACSNNANAKEEIFHFDETENASEDKHLEDIFHYFSEMFGDVTLDKKRGTITINMKHEEDGQETATEECAQNETVTGEECEANVAECDCETDKEAACAGGNEEKQEKTCSQCTDSVVADTCAAEENETTTTCAQQADGCENESVAEEEHEPTLSDEEEERMLQDLEELLREDKAPQPQENKDQDYVAEIQKAVQDDATQKTDTQQADASESEKPLDLDVDQLFSGIFNQNNEEDVKTEKEEVSEDLPEEKEDIDSYVQQLVDELRTEEEKEEAETKTETPVEEELPEQDDEEKEDTNEDDIYQQINEMYPYLSSDFIHRVYELKEAIAQNYPLNEMMVVLHRVHFDRLDDLQQFVEIVSNHGYNVNVDETKMIVDLFRRYLNTDGKILSNIFEIANQASLLHGVYEGYWIDTQKDEE